MNEKISGVVVMAGNGGGWIVVAALMIVNGVDAVLTIPSPQPLPYSFTSQSSSNLPAGMAMHKFGILPLTRTPQDASDDLPCFQLILNQGGWRYLDADGIGILASGAQNAGAMVVAIDTTGKSGITVSWKCGTAYQQTFRDNSVALQYRGGDTGPFTDVGTSTTYTSQGKVAGDWSAVLTELLPADADNQATVHVRWIYWESYSIGGGSRDRIAIDDISIDSTVPPDDPNLFAASVMRYGAVAPGSVTTQSLAVLNNGMSNTLALAGFEPFSGTTDTFSVIDLPGSLEPGSSAVVRAACAPGNVTGVSFSAVFNLLCNDPGSPTNPITLSGYTPGDPSVVVTSTVQFGLLEPGATATQDVLVANQGVTNDLLIGGFEPSSGLTARFSALSVPAIIAPGASDILRIVYAPGQESNAYHAAEFNLVSNDPASPTNPVTLIGATIAGLVTVSNIQYTTSPDGSSMYTGQVVDVIGIVTYVEPSSSWDAPNAYAISDPQGGPWSGVYVYDATHRPEYGDQVRLRATVDESFGLTELKEVVSFSVLDTSNDVPPAVVTCETAGQEEFEGVLVCVSNVTVDMENTGSTSEWRVIDASASNLLVGVRCPYRFVWHTGQSLTALVGHVYFSWGTFKLEPRFDDDFSGRPVVEYALGGTVITPLGPKSNWFVHVWDDDIIAVTDAPPAGVLVVNTDGIIFPGLIDAHNHPSYNSFPTLMFNNFPFGHRDEWGTDDPEYDNWKAKRTLVRNNPGVNDGETDRITKYGELLELMAGCVTIQGQSNSDKEHSHPDMLLCNIEQFPARSYFWQSAAIFPWTMSAIQRADIATMTTNGVLNAFIMHLGEGPDETSRQQFDTWFNWGMLDNVDAIVHGTSFGSNEFAKMAAVGAKLLWSPMSNMKLYEATANAALAHELGVTVGLSPDWTPSGGYNLLEELGYAWYLNQTMFSNYFTAQQMTEMVTVNNAAACGLCGRFGVIAPGANAGLCVIGAVTNDPYLSLIFARPRSVKLTTVDGMPRFGDPGILMALGVTGETASVSGTDKMFNIAVNHPFLRNGADSVAVIRSNIAAAHATLTTNCPTGELDADELQFLDFSLLEAGPDTILPFRADNPVSSPASGSEFVMGSPTNMSFRRQDFWDNETDSRDLVHREIAIVPRIQPDAVMQAIATDVRNYTSAVNKEGVVPFTPSFTGPGTDFVFRFITADRLGNQRTSVIDAVSFTVVPEPAGAAVAIGWVLLIAGGKKQRDLVSAKSRS